MEEALKHGDDAVVTHLDATEVLQPGVGTLDFPAFVVATELAFVLESTVADVFSMGLVQWTDGNFYGTVLEGGAFNHGAVSAMIQQDEER